MSCVSMKVGDNMLEQEVRIGVCMGNFQFDDDLLFVGESVFDMLVIFVFVLGCWINL